MMTPNRMAISSGSTDVICDPPRRYCFTATEGLPWYPEETAMGEQVDKFEGEFLLTDQK
jgi:hypothetical protein